jgi:AraC-like DNA-binding protein
LKVSDDLKQPYVEEILPDGHHEVIFHLNSSSRRKKNNSEAWNNDPATYFAGQNRKSYTQQLNPGTVLYGVRFHPHTQNLFYNFPASLSTDNQIAFADISRQDSLADCINESPGKTFARLEKEFLKKAAQLKTASDTFLYVEAAVQFIVRQKGNVKVEALEKLTGVSSRHLEKSFQKYVGVSPKQFCNMIRFNSFVIFRRDHPGMTLTECAHETDFHDQSHLIYLSRQITGQSPKAYFNKLNYINDYFVGC